MNKEKAAKIILTIIILAFIMIQFTANIITIKNAYEETRKVNAATEEIVNIYLKPQNVAYKDGQAGILYQGGLTTPIKITYNLSTNEAYKEQASQFFEFNTTYSYQDDEGMHNYGVSMIGTPNVNNTVEGGYGKNTIKFLKSGDGQSLQGAKLARVNIQFLQDSQDLENAGSTLTFYYENNLEISFSIKYPVIETAPLGEGSDTFYINGALSQSAYDAGYNAGTKDKTAYGQSEFNRGKAIGEANANEYTFEKLISAVFDVPIQTIYGIFNFEILGINILNFVLALVSLMVVVAILKLVI